jgi:glycosyltransferase involved in cell wall biosynthesis
VSGWDPADRDAHTLAKIGDVAAAAGIRSIEMVAWRDLDHPEAGGSEVHAAALAERWAAAGIEVTLVASRPEGVKPPPGQDGYRVERPAGRYRIFPAVAAPRLISRAGRLASRGSHRRRPGRAGRRGPDATVEIWNGMPFFSPLWADRPRLVFLHHVHDRMWDLVLPHHLAAAGRFVESRLAPPVYRRSEVVTLSESSRQGIVDRLGLDPRRVHVVPPGVGDAFVPGPAKNPRPLVVAVGRLVRYKRFDLLVDVLAGLKDRHPDLQAVIAGEGADRPRLEALVARHRASDWIGLPGRVDDDSLVDLYQRAWALASTSAFEGWGMTISEAAACATPAVVSPITGHRDVVVDGVTGFLAEPGPDMAARLDALVGDARLRRRLAQAARHQAETLTWERTALETLRLLADQAAQSGPTGPDSADPGLQASPGSRTRRPPR